jgi:hypothetical protein
VLQLTAGLLQQQLMAAAAASACRSLPCSSNTQLACAIFELMNSTMSFAVLLLLLLLLLLFCFSPHVVTSTSTRTGSRLSHAPRD